MTADAVADDLAAVAEIAGVLADMLDAKNADLAGLEERNAELSGQVEDLSRQLRDVLERVAKLERQVSRNSGNSGMSPSTDDLPGRTPPGPRPERGRRTGKKRQGKQPGAPGAHLAWSDDPDDTLPLFPQGERGCGRRARVIARIRRFKCLNPRCVQATFSEQITGLTTPFARAPRR